ncbi:MAG: hypothetical protein WCC63_07385 [Candidatus Bathyarchaeia archaeon]
MKLRCVLNVGEKWKKAISETHLGGDEEKAYCRWGLALESSPTDAKTVDTLNSILRNRKREGIGNECV